MKTMRRAIAILGRLTYALGRYRFLSMRLDMGLLAALALGLAYLAWRAWRQGLTAPYIAALLMGLLVWGSLWYARRHGHAFFWTLPLPDGPGLPVLADGEKWWLRGTGWFQVADKCRRLVETPLMLWRTELGDYILMARYSARALPLLDNEADQQGLWYIFVAPRDIQGIATGQVSFGLTERWALRLRYGPHGSKAEELYLTGDGPEAIQRLEAELRGRLASLSRPRG